MSLRASPVADPADRLFSERIDRAALAAFESGQWPAALWAQIEQLGFADLLVPESEGGYGGDWQDAYHVLRAAGEHCLPLPLADTLIGRHLLAVAGVPRPVGALALIDAAHQPELGLEIGAGGAVRLSGLARNVSWARWCEAAVVCVVRAETRLIACVPLRGASSISLIPASNIAGEPLDTLNFSDTPAAQCARTPLALSDPIWCLGALARSLASVGALESTLEMSVRYARERVQFGKPIARNQAVQHMLAVMAGEVSAARMAAQVAAIGASPALSTSMRFDLAVAKVRTAQASGKVAALAHQIHGAMGTTLEYALNFRTRRLWSWRREYGSDAWWSERLGEAALQAGGAGVWPAIAARSLALPG